MNTDEIIMMGWKPRHLNDKTDFEMNGHIMGVHPHDDGLFMVIIKYVHEKAVSNFWENSDCVFYGFLYDEKELLQVMKFVGVIGR